MEMQINQLLAVVLLRVALAAGFLSAVASRLGLWGEKSSGWQGFVKYTSEVNSFLPTSFAPMVAVISTVLEITLGLLLLAGFKTQYAALCAAILSLLFAIAMAISSGIKEPLDYSVFAFSAGAFLLASFSKHQWSLDQFITK